jgi:hypothetical protein
VPLVNLAAGLLRRTRCWSCWSRLNWRRAMQARAQQPRNKHVVSNTRRSVNFAPALGPSGQPALRRGRFVWKRSACSESRSPQRQERRQGCGDCMRVGATALLRLARSVLRRACSGNSTVTVAVLDKPFVYRLMYLAPWCCEDASLRCPCSVLGKRSSQMNPADRFGVNLSHRIRAPKVSPSSNPSRCFSNYNTAATNSIPGD